VSSSDTAIVARSLIFNALFYVNITIRMIVALPTILLPYSFLHGVLRRYASSTLWFLRVVCGTKVEWRGREKLPAGPCIVACKHQSLWETFALFKLLPDPT
jgi:1-acyl-sn-glycerol-3-phosphate acyltransferase